MKLAATATLKEVVLLYSTKQKMVLFCHCKLS